jgi:hypothetical protein
MPPTLKHDATHTLLYAIITHLSPPSADDKVQWQQIAELLPDKPWGDAVFESWRKVQTRAQKDGWLASKSKKSTLEKNEKNEGEGDVKPAFQKKHAGGTRQELVEKVDWVERNVQLRRGLKRTRANKNIKGLESSEEEVIVIGKGQKDVERKIATLRRGSAVLRRKSVTSMTAKSERAALFKKKFEDSDSDSNWEKDSSKKAVGNNKSIKGFSAVSNGKGSKVVAEEKEKNDEFLDDED